MRRALSLSDFKHWLSEQDDTSEMMRIEREREAGEELIGKKVKSRVSENKLSNKIETDYDPVCVVQEFVENGGTIIAVDGKRLQIEVESGDFMVPRIYVRVKKD